MNKKHFKMNRKYLLVASLFIILSIFKPLASNPKKAFKRGEGVIEYTQYKPLEDKPISLFYYIPTRGNIKKMRILFSMHGAERSGSLQRNTWRNLAEEYGFIVLAPQYSREYYKENDYQFGGVSEKPDEFILRPREVWTYQSIEAIFDYFKECTGNTSKVYDMFGHSAGGQFVHRYLLATPEARVGRAVAANAGNYSYPDENGIRYSEDDIAGWPWSIYETPMVSEEYLVPFFKRDLIILIGDQDISPQLTEKNINTHPVRGQGLTRLDRAWKFFELSRGIALQKGYEYNHRILEVPGAGHSSAQMVHGQRRVRNWRESGGRYYNIKDITNFGAFSLIYEQ